MSDPFDDGLASALKSAVPELPGEFDPLEIIGASRPPRVRRWVAPVAVAALVMGIAVGVVVARGGGDRPRAAVGQRASQIYGSWVLTDLHGMNNAMHTRPHFTGAFGFAADGAVHGGCVATQSTITSESITFDHGWPDLLVSDCRRLPPAQSRFVFGRVLHGRTPWRLSGGVLTIGGTTASIVLTRPQALDNGQVRARLYQLAVDAARQQGVQIDAVSAAFAETRSAASSVLHLVPSPYVAPMWVLQIRAAQPFLCGQCHSQIPGHRPERFRYLYLYADLHARRSAPAGISTHAADLAELGTVVRLTTSRERGRSIDRPEPVVSSGRLTDPISFGDGSTLLRPPSVDDTPAITADAALAAFKATGFTVKDDNARPIIFLAALTDFHNSTETTPAGRPVPTSTDRLIWVIEYPDVPSMPSGGGLYPEGSPAPPPQKPVLEDVLGIADAQTGKLEAIITTLPDPAVIDLSRAPIPTGGKPSPAAS